MSIATKRGDGGQTGLAGGIRVSKSDLRVEAYGTVDELNTFLGFARSICTTSEIRVWTEEIQKDLFRLGSALATPPESKKTPPKITSEDVDRLTDLVHRIEAQDGILSDWSLPGALTEAAAFEVSRTVCRRAERNAIRLAERRFRSSRSNFLSEPAIGCCLAFRKIVGVSSRSRFPAARWRAQRREVVSGMVAGTSDVFEESELRGVYRAIRERRDVRSGFLPEPLPEDVLLRLLEAAHNAPSVGLMQPWRFILIRDGEVRNAVHDIFVQANRKAAECYEGERAELYHKLKLEGILEAPQNLCIVCDPSSNQGHGLGRQSMPETVIYSAVCAVQNFWLAARAEGVGVGWVSILDPDTLKKLLGIPAGVVLVAYLCMGYVKGFESRPELERLGWEQHVNLKNVLRSEHYDRAYVPQDQSR